MYIPLGPWLISHVTRIFAWKPKNNIEAELKTKAMSCLTLRQQEVAKILVMPAIQNLGRSKRNSSQHPRTSQEFAKAAVRTIFDDLKLGDTHKPLTISHFDDIIQNAGLPLGGDDQRPFFLEKDEDENSPSKLQEEIAIIKDEIEHLNVIIKEGEEQLANWS